MIVVSDCVKASEVGGFLFSHEDQKRYLRSMVAYHLGEVLDGFGIATESAIAVDADFPGFFTESDIENLDIVLQEFGVRIRLEMAIKAFLRKSETKK